MAQNEHTARLLLPQEPLGRFAVNKRHRTKHISRHRNNIGMLGNHCETESAYQGQVWEKRQYQGEGHPMIKVIILGCAICAGAGGTLVWMKSGGDAVTYARASMSPISIQQMHSNAHMDGLPIQSFDAH